MRTKSASVAIERIETLLRDKGLKVTRARLAIVQVLMRAGAPLSIEEIKRGVGDAANAVTVYRVLEQLVEIGLVYQTDFRSGKAYFEYQEVAHHHIVCTQCGAREEVGICLEVDPALALKRSKKFHSIESHALEFFGTCKECKKEQK